MKTNAYKTFQKIVYLQKAFERRVLKKFNLTTNMYEVLSILSTRDNSMLLNTLKEISPCPFADFSRMLERMEERDLIKRKLSRNGTRANVISLTAKGKKMIPRIDQSFADFPACYFNRLTKKDQFNLDIILNKLRKRYG